MQECSGRIEISANRLFAELCKGNMAIYTWIFLKKKLPSHTNIAV